MQLLKTGRILFLCLGNICRSPTAESIFRQRAQKQGLTQMFFDSAGTGGYHIGERSDPRSIKHAQNRGYEMTHLARQLSVADFEAFDLILAMDEKNMADAGKICPPNLKNKLQLVTDYCVTNKNGKKHTFVPDPYYGNEADFELVIDILEDASNGFFKS